MILLKKITFWLALAGVFFAGMLIRQTHAQNNEPMPEPPVAPAHKPFAKAIGAAGIIEAMHENTSIGVPAAGLVAELFVKEWDSVKTGQPLLRIDSRDLQAQLIGQEAEVDVARATLERLRGQLERLLAVKDQRAIAMEELRTKKSDIAVAEAQLKAATARVAQTNALIERLTVRAPCAGMVLRVNTRAGEYANPSANTSLMLIGDTDRLQIRADVDEQLAPRVKEGSRAVATLKGNSSVVIPLEFVRIEPFITPKQSLTGASVERVDTRVLQVIFKCANSGEPRLYVGQQVDLYIEE